MPGTAVTADNWVDTVTPLDVKASGYDKVMNEQSSDATYTFSYPIDVPVYRGVITFLVIRTATGITIQTVWNPAHPLLGEESAVVVFPFTREPETGGLTRAERFDTTLKGRGCPSASETRDARKGSIGFIGDLVPRRQPLRILPAGCRGVVGVHPERRIDRYRIRKQNRATLPSHFFRDTSHQGSGDAAHRWVLVGFERFAYATDLRTLQTEVAELKADVAELKRASGE